MSSDVEEQIRRAMAEGKFDQLPGKGKPLKLQDDPYEDPEWRMAHHLLRSSGFSLGWIEERKEIETDLKSARLALRRAWAWQEAARARGDSTDWVEAEWARAREAFEAQVEHLNRRIRDYNLQVPSERFHLRRVGLGQELDALSQS